MLFSKFLFSRCHISTPRDGRGMRRQALEAGMAGAATSADKGTRVLVVGWTPVFLPVRCAAETKRCNAGSCWKNASGGYKSP
jgi:hypothetical protein